MTRLPHLADGIKTEDSQSSWNEIIFWPGITNHEIKCLRRETLLKHGNSKGTKRTIPAADNRVQYSKLYDRTHTQARKFLLDNGRETHSICWNPIYHMLII